MSRDVVLSAQPELKKKRRKIPPRQALEEFRDLIWPRRGALALGLGLVIINRLAGLVLPGSMKRPARAGAAVMARKTSAVDNNRLSIGDPENVI